MKLFQLLILFIFITNLTANNVKKISLQLQWKHQFEFAGFYIAKEKGFYRDVGLDIDIKEFDSGTNIIKDVESGKTTFGTSYPTIILEKSKGMDVVLLGAILQSSPHVLVSLKSSDINSIKDFRNKRIMINKDALQTTSFISMFKSNGISIDDIIKVKHSFNIKDLIDKKIDITTAFLSNELYTLDKQNIQYNLWDPKDYGFDFYDVIGFTSTKTLKNNPEMVNNFQKASLKGWEYAFNNIEETANLILKKYNTQNKTKDALIYEAKVLKKLAYYNTNKLGDIDKKKIQRIYDIYNLMGLTKNKINFDEFIYQPQVNNKINLTLEEREYLKNKKKLTLCVKPNMIPYEGIKNGKYIGISADYLNIISSQLNIPLEVLPVKTNLDTLKLTKNKKCDLKPIILTNNVKMPYKATKAYINDYFSLVTNIEQPFISNLDKFMDKTFVMTSAESGVAKTIKKSYPQIKLIMAKSIDESLKMVLNHKAFGFIGKSLASIHYIQKYYPSKLKVINEFKKSNLGIGVIEDDKILLNIMNKALDSIDEKDKIKIRNSWTITTVTNGIDYTFIWYILGIVTIIILAFIYRQYILNKSNKNLQRIVEDKTKDLKKLNKNLQKKVEEKTKEQTLLIESLPIAIQGYNKNREVVYWNKKSEEIYGYSSKEAINKQLEDLIIPDFMKDDVIKANNNWYYNDIAIPSAELPLIRKDGSTVLVYSSHIMIKDEFNNQTMFCMDIDLTIQKKLQENDKVLAEQSKMASMGDMIGNIAHQWRQPLSVISTAASGIQISKDLNTLTDKEENKLLEIIVKNTKFLSETIDTFRDYIKEKKELKEVILQDRINIVINIVIATLKNNHIELINNIDNKELIKITIVIGELSQVIINLINNAKDVLLENNVDKPFVKIDLIKKEDKVIITVEDNGGGIPDDIFTKIFDPYFTTKHQSIGTGLGLHMSKDIIEKSLNGRLYAKNINDGVVFSIELPLSKT